MAVDPLATRYLRLRGTGNRVRLVKPPRPRPHSRQTDRVNRRRCRRASTFLHNEAFRELSGASVDLKGLRTYVEARERELRSG